eukprot:SAG25_NODE_1122_length_3887_cov_2.126188_5_plen_68_part_00
MAAAVNDRRTALAGAEREWLFRLYAIATYGVSTHVHSTGRCAGAATAIECPITQSSVRKQVTACQQP